MLWIIRAAMPLFLAAVAREHMEPDLSLMVLTTLGVTVDDLASEGAGPHDLALLRPDD